MSIIIKGMDMPKEALSVTVEWWDENDMQIRYDDIDIDRVIEIPTPHGRLIDENDLIDHYWYYDADDEEGHFSRNVCEYDIERAPTILEAEE